MGRILVWHSGNRSGSKRGRGGEGAEGGAAPIQKSGSLFPTLDLDLDLDLDH